MPLTELCEGASSMVAPPPDEANDATTFRAVLDFATSLGDDFSVDIRPRPSAESRGSCDQWPRGLPTNDAMVLLVMTEQPALAHTLNGVLLEKLGLDIQGVRNTTIRGLVEEIDPTSLSRMIG
jgi:hypothetical protein